MFCFKHEDKNYDIRVICNSEKKTVIFQSNSLGKISCKDSYILACNDAIPEAFLAKFKPLAEKPSVFSAKINSVYPLDYTAYPKFN